MSRHAYAPQIDARPRRLSPERERAIEILSLRDELAKWQEKKDRATNEQVLCYITANIETIERRIAELEASI